MKTIEEKAKVYAESYRLNGAVCATEALLHIVEKSYLAGATEALSDQWRNVADELPKDEKCVLVHIDHSDDTKRMDDFSKESLEDAIGHTIAYYHDGRWTFMDEYFYDCKIDRWMPIPDFTPKTKVK